MELGPSTGRLALTSPQQTRKKQTNVDHSLATLSELRDYHRGRATSINFISVFCFTIKCFRSTRIGANLIANNISSYEQVREIVNTYFPCFMAWTRPPECQRRMVSVTRTRNRDKSESTKGYFLLFHFTRAKKFRGGKGGWLFKILGATSWYQQNESYYSGFHFRHMYRNRWSIKRKIIPDG